MNTVVPEELRDCGKWDYLKVPDDPNIHIIQRVHPLSLDFDWDHENLKAIEVGIAKDEETARRACELHNQGLDLLKGVSFRHLDHDDPNYDREAYVIG